MHEEITLIAEEKEVKAPRNVLIKHSLYFCAALESGMSEATSGQFTFPNLSAEQVALVANCARTNFADWPSTQLIASNTECGVESELNEVLILSDAADYLQIAVLSNQCFDRLSDILHRLFEPDSIQEHLRHDCGIYSSWFRWWKRLGESYECPYAQLLLKYALRHPYLLLQPDGTDTPPSPTTIELTVSLLSSDLLCVSDETIVLNLVMAWITNLRSKQLSSLSQFQALLDCVRLGLLPKNAQHQLLEFWSQNLPYLKWKDKLTCGEFSILIERYPEAGPFSGLRNGLKLNDGLPHYPRASTPCLVSLIPSLCNSAIEFWLFNLSNGHYHRIVIPDQYLRQISNDTYGSGDLDRRIFLCHPSTDIESNSHLITVLCYDPFGSVLSGFVWCMATGQAQWLPRLSLASLEPGRSECGVSASLSVKRIGLATFSSGLYTYCTSSAQSDIWLHAYRFDFITWRWESFIPVALFPTSSTGIALFTPVEQLCSVPTDGWLYANIEVADRLDTRDSHIRRQNLHQTSQVRSHFFRFRPVPKASTLLVEPLPSPPFLIRIYKILPLTATDSARSTSRNYLFAFGTCSRDQSAVQYCFDVVAQRWIGWSTYRSQTAEDDSHTQSPSVGTRSLLQTNLSEELLGFRGLVHATRILDLWNPRKSVLSLHDQTPISNQSSVSRLGPTLVLAGRSDHHIHENKESSSGIWFHYPQANPFDPRLPLDIFQPWKPFFPLPNAIAQILYRSPCPTAVLFANWDKLVHFKEIFHFIESHSEPNISSVFQASRPTPSSSGFSCFNRSSNSSPGDSD
ncbi:unnamed protein product [Calicophoron daubneyi]|uniref:BTB domain-containing protein n=1 Tax=Calicophoron daubneyi TaxID=300641 RepID=A0AAV2U1B5_CALDB